MESNVLIELVYRMIGLLEEIAENTRPEKVEEPKNTITGFSAGDKK